MNRLGIWAVLVAATLWACGDETASTDGSASGSGEGGESSSDVGDSDAGSSEDRDGETVGGGGTDAGSGGGGTDTGSGGGGTDAGSDAGATDAGADAAVPCEIAAVLEAACGQCHGATPAFGAPMSLVSLADLQAPSRTNPERTMAEQSLIRAQDTTSPMPPVPNAPLEAAALDALQAWIDAGLPERVEACGDDSDAGTDTDDGGAIIDPVLDTSGCEYQIEFRAHEFSEVGDETPNVVEPGVENYQCFYFGMPWGLDAAQALWFRPLIDDERVLHHYLLYGTSELDRPAGTSARCSGTHPNAALLTGWAPGGQPLVLPEGVGLELPQGPNAGFILEIHYNNAAGYDDVADRSGVEMCATRDLQPEAAATHWLGSEAILLLRQGETDVYGTCRPETDEEIHIIQSWPHMHRHGVHMTTEVFRADGSREMVVDVPFDFDNQIPYAVDVRVQPGDELRTRCTFNNTSGGIVGFGARTEDEMCYNFIVAYPAGALASGGMFNQGDNFCLR